MNILIIASQQFPGTTDTGLYLICDEQDIMLFAEVVAPAEITVIGNNYPCIGSNRRPTTSGSCNASANASTLLYCTLIKPGVYGPKSS